MIATIFVVLLIVALIGAYATAQRSATRQQEAYDLLAKANVDLQKAKDAIHAEWMQVLADLADMRAQRDAVLVEPRYVALTGREISALAKTGCGHCHGAGHFRDASLEGVDCVCNCVAKRMAHDKKYAQLPDGTPARLATKEEVVRLNAENKGGAQC